MSDQMLKEAPPAYEPPEEVPDMLVDRIRATIDAERGHVGEDSADAARMRNFLLYCLAIDYRCVLGLTLSASDRNHYVDMSTLLQDVQASHDRTDLTRSERRTLAPFFGRYLQEPCRNLGISVECAILLVFRFTRWQNSYGHYKGCAYGVLQSDGVEGLAHKISMDWNLLIPRLATSIEMRTQLAERLENFASLYFTTIEGYTTAIYESRIGSLAEAKESSFSLTERGKSYAKTRDDTIRAAKSSSVFSPSYLLSRAKACIPGSNASRENFPRGKRWSDQQGTWMGDQKAPLGTPNSDPIWSAPPLWSYRQGSTSQSCLSIGLASSNAIRDAGLSCRCTWA